MLLKLFVLMLYIPVNNCSVDMFSGLPGLNHTKQICLFGLIVHFTLGLPVLYQTKEADKVCLAQEHNTALHQA